MPETETNVVQAGNVWRVLVQSGPRQLLEYRYASESQARFMAAVFRLTPSRLPTPHAVWACKKATAPRSAPAAKRTRARSARARAPASSLHQALLSATADAGLATAH